MHDLILSTSSISAYLRCHYAYFLGYVWRWKGQQNVAAAIGQAVHAGVEAMHKEEGLFLIAAKEAWDLESANVPQADLEADPDAFSDALRMLDVYESEVLPTFHPFLVEAPFSVRVDGVIITGTIDAADEDLRDTKTTAGKTINGRKPNFDPANHDLQLSLYRLGYWGLTGKYPRRLLLDVLTRRGTYRQYQREPRTADAISTLGVVRDGIVREEYDPNGALNGSCGYCSFSARCGYAVRDT
jgi:hypothetical protein